MPTAGTLSPQETLRQRVRQAAEKQAGAKGYLHTRRVISDRIGTTMTVLVHRIPAAAYDVLEACPGRVSPLEPSDLASGAVARLLSLMPSDGHGFAPFALQGSSVDCRDGSGRTTHAWAALRSDDAFVAVIGLRQVVVEGDARFSIPWLLVDPAERRRGVATGLVRTALAAAAEAGGTHVAVETLARWSASSAFWAQIVERTTGRGNQPSSSP